MRRIFLFLLTMIVVYSCMIRSEDHQQTKIINYCKAINMPGLYNLENQEFSVDIKYIDNFVRFKVFNNNGDILFFNKDLNISKFQKWSCCIDSLNILWIDSSDIGLYKVVLNLEGGFSVISCFGEINKSNVDSIPECIYSGMPSCIKDDFPQTK